MERRQIQANLFVAVMVALGVGVLWRWHSSRAAAEPRQFDTYEPFRDMRLAQTKEIQGAHMSIEGQLNAFKTDNYKLATTYQSAMLRGNSQSVDAFRATIQHIYPEFSRYHAIKYGEIHATKDGNVLAVPVTVTGEDGITVRALYRLDRENGIYRVSGVDGGRHMEWPRRGPFPLHHGFGHEGPGFDHDGPGVDPGRPRFEHDYTGIDHNNGMFAPRAPYGS